MTNLLANGSFEVDTNLNRGNWGTFASIYGWRALNGEQIELQNKSLVGVGSADGNQHLELDAGNAGNSGVYQDVVNAGDAGSEYKLKFSYSPRWEVAGTDANDVEVWWDGKKIATLSGDTQGWQDYEFTITSGKDKGDISQLMFKSAGSNTGYGGLIDNVSLEVEKLVKTGTANNDVIHGDVGDDILDGAYGDDIIQGKDGDDIIYGDTSHTGTEYMPLDLKHGDGYARAYTMQDNRFGEIVNFTGSYTQADASYADAGDFVTSSNFSFASWVKFKHSHNNNWERIFDFGNGAGDDNILLAREGTSNNIAFHVYDGHNQNQIAINAQNVITTNQWMHVAVTMSEDASGQTTAKLYINGQEQASTSGHYNIATMARDNNYIAKSNWSQDGVSNIQMAGITIADRGYTANEISNVKTATDNPANVNAVKITRDIQTDANPDQHGADIIDGGSGDDSIFGNGGNDIIRGNEGKDYIDAGDGDDHIVVVGTVKAGEYSTADDTSVANIKLADGDTRDVTDLLSLDTDLTNTHTVSDITAGETIIGGAGTDTLHIYGSVDLRHVDFSSIETIALNSDLTVDIEDLATDSSIVGNSKGKSFSTLKLDTELDGKQFFDLSNFYQVKNISMVSFLDEDITMQIHSKEEFDGLALKSIIGKGTVQITSSSINLGASNVVLGNDVKIVNGLGAEITDSALGLTADQRRSDSDITNANFNYYKPEAKNETYDFTIDEDETLTLSYDYLTANDIDRDGDRDLTIVQGSIEVMPKVGTNIKYGSVNVDHNNKQFDFTPTANHSGTVKVKYKTQDSGGKVSDNYGELTINIKAINDAPVITELSATIDEDTTKEISLASLLATASDVEGDSLTLIKSSIKTDSTKASLSYKDTTGDNKDDTLVITPNANYFGDVIVSYDISDGTDTTTGKYNLTVNNVNDAPTITALTETIDEDTSKTITVQSLFDTASDIDGDSLTISNIRLDTASQSNGKREITNVNSDSNILNDTVKITPNADYFGNLVLLYDINDGTVTKTGKYTLTVNNVQDAPKAKAGVTAVGYSDEDTKFTITYDTLRSFFTDADGDTLLIKNIALASANTNDANIDRTVANQITIDPTLNYNGTITINYDVDDDNGNIISTDYKLVVNPVNDDPIANDDSVITSIGSDTYTINFANKLLSNDSDVDGDSLKVTSIRLKDSSKGTLDNIDYSGGTADFKFASGITEAKLQYVVSDGNGGTDTAEVLVTVGGLTDSVKSISLSNINLNVGYNIKGNIGDGHNSLATDHSWANQIGDYNGDGYDDYLVLNYDSADDKNNQKNHAYIILGKGNRSNIDLSNINNQEIITLKLRDSSGNLKVKADFTNGIGDFNGDGYDDFAIGRPADNTVYIVYGSNSTNDIDMTSTSQSDNIVKISNANIITGGSDVNGDGIDDISFRGVGDNHDHRPIYTIFGKSGNDSYKADFTRVNGLIANKDYSEFDSNGLQFVDPFQYPVSNGDINGDGYGDYLYIDYADSGGGVLTIAYGVARDSDGKTNMIYHNLYKGYPSQNYNDIGKYVTSTGGDFNNDGRDDFMYNIGATTYVKYGRDRSVAYENYNDVSKAVAITNLGNSYSGGFIGDFNGDGFGDMAFATGTKGYIVYGQKNGNSNYIGRVDITKINTGNNLKGLEITGLDNGKVIVERAGDLNGDGIDDVIFASSGVDSKSLVLYGFVDATIKGTDNNDTIRGTDDTNNGDIINAGKGNDTINAGKGNDTVYGGLGDDKINGGKGDDILNGGDGNDEFIFDNGFGNDIILDFEDDKDKIDLQSYTKSDGAGGTEAIDASDVNITQHNGDVKITINGTNDVIIIRDEFVANITSDSSGDFIFG